jgi:S1-C subfamily serine protease
MRALVAPSLGGFVRLALLLGAQVACAHAEQDAAAPRPAPAATRDAEEVADTGYLSLQRRVSEVFDDGSRAVVRVKAAFDEAPEEGRPKVALKVGTGFFVSREGHVVTNASIATGANRVWVEYEGRSHAAEVLGAEPESNFALLRLAEPPKGATVLPLSSSGVPHAGSFVVAVTAPLDLSPSPSFGMVAGRDRSFGDRTFPIRFLRVTVPAGPGEGGAPVMDLSGRVIGMMIASIPELRSSYVLPAQALARLRDDVVFHGGVRPGWVGMDLEERTVPGATRREVFVQSVLPDTPAAAAGLRPGDHVVRVDGLPVSSLDEFRESSFYARIGQVIALQVMRGGELVDVAVTVRARPPPKAVVEATERASSPLEPEPRVRRPAK